MTTYEVAPYSLTVRPRGSTGDHRAIDDIDANGGALRDYLAKTLTRAMVSGQKFRLPKHEDVSFRVSDVRLGERILYYVVNHGSSGIESTIDDRTESQVFNRQPHHVENIAFRNLAVFPRNGHRAILLTERVGGRGIAAFNGKLLKDSGQANLQGSIFAIDPLATAADLDSVPIFVESISFEFPHHADPTGRFTDVTGLDGFFSMRYKLRKKKKLTAYRDESGTRIAPEKIFGVIDGALSALGMGTTGAGLKKLGAAAKIKVQLPAGNERSFQLGAADGPALVYPLVASSSTARGPERPSDSDFVNVACEVLSDLRGNFGVTDQTVSECVLPAPQAALDVEDTWKVVWNVPDHTNTDNS